MKLHTLPVKRRPATKGIFKRLSAVTGPRKQRVAAAASADLEMEDGGSKISRAMTIIFLIHIVAVGLIFVHLKYLDSRGLSGEEAAENASDERGAVAGVRRENPVKLSSGAVPYMVRAGDNYARIAAAEGVDEGALRTLNQDKEIRPGVVLSIPPKRIVALEPPELTALRNLQQQAPAAAPAADDGLVEALPVDVSGAPRAQLVRASGLPPAVGAAAQPSAASGKTYVVQSGDSVWRIANRFGVNQDALMKANGITDARKMKIGMSLVIP
jgi:LysM repeat protein